MALLIEVREFTLSLTILLSSPTTLLKLSSS